jgi:hypothetical protein
LSGGEVSSIEKEEESGKIGGKVRDGVEKGIFGGKV